MREVVEEPTRELIAAEYLMGETFASAYEKRRRFRGASDAQAGAWLWAIVRSKLARYRRSRNIESNALARLGLERPKSADEELRRVEELSALEEAHGHIQTARRDGEDSSLFEISYLRVDRNLMRVSYRQRLRAHLTYANVASSLALFLAIGGTAYATGAWPAGSVGSAQLRPAAVTASKLASGSVGPMQLQGGAVIASKLAAGSVGQTKLKPGSVTAKALADESVDMASLTAGLRRALLRPRVEGTAGPQGRAGERGATGEAGATGPGAHRIHYFQHASASSTRTTIAELDGLALEGQCEEAGPGTRLNLAIVTSEAASGIESISLDSGTGTPNFAESHTANLQIELPAGTTPLGGPSTAPGEYARILAHMIFVTPSDTLDFNIGLVLDGTAETCSIDGTAVAATA